VLQARLAITALLITKSQVARQIRNYQKKYLARWREAKVDALIMPVQPYVGFRPKEWCVSSQYVGYSSQWNLVDYSALSMPVEVDYPEDLPATGNGRSSWKEHKPRNEADRYNWEQCKCKPEANETGDLTYITDDTKLVKGMPVSIQIVGGKFGEENAVAVAKALEEALKL